MGMPRVEKLRYRVEMVFAAITALSFLLGSQAGLTALSRSEKHRALERKPLKAPDSGGKKILVGQT